MPLLVLPLTLDTLRQSPQDQVLPSKGMGKHLAPSDKPDLYLGFKQMLVHSMA